MTKVNIGRRAFITADSIRNYLDALQPTQGESTRKMLVVFAESGAAREGDKPDMRPIIARDHEGRLYECRPIE